MSAALLKQKAKTLSTMWTETLETYHLVCAAEETELPSGFKTSASNKYFNCLNKQEETVAKIQELIHILEPAVSPTTIMQVPSQTPTASGHNLSLPLCDTEIFYGGYEQWTSFRDMFTAVYINHPKLSPAQKLYHLRHKTRGKALDIIKKFELSDRNFELAWEALRARYDNKRILGDNQLETLMNLKTVRYENSEALQKLQSTINNCISALNNQEVDTSNWDPVQTLYI